MYKCADLRCKTAIIRRFFVIRKLIYYTNSVSCGLTKKRLPTGLREHLSLMSWNLDPLELFPESALHPNIESNLLWGQIVNFKPFSFKEFSCKECTMQSKAVHCVQLVYSDMLTMLLIL